MLAVALTQRAKTLSSSRYTPYHVAHRTEVMGFMTFLHGDMRFYNNIFVQQEVHPALVKMQEFAKEHYNQWDDSNVDVGTFKYDGYPTFEEWDKEFEGYCGMGSSPATGIISICLCGPAATCTSAEPRFGERRPTPRSFREKVTLNLKEQDGKYTLETNLYELMPEVKTPSVSTEFLGAAFEPEEKFENPDGTPIIFNQDYFGRHRAVNPKPGPFEAETELQEALF